LAASLTRSLHDALPICTVGTYAATADQRFTFGVLELVEGVNFIAVIIGLFGIAELFDQLLTHRKSHVRPISSLGRWWPNRSEQLDRKSTRLNSSHVKIS